MNIFSTPQDPRPRPKEWRLREAQKHAPPSGALLRSMGKRKLFWGSGSDSQKTWATTTAPASREIQRTTEKPPIFRHCSCASVSFPETGGWGGGGGAAFVYLFVLTYVFVYTKKEAHKKLKQTMCDCFWR